MAILDCLNHGSYETLPDAGASDRASVRNAVHDGLGHEASFVQSRANEAICLDVGSSRLGRKEVFTMNWHVLKVLFAVLSLVAFTAPGQTATPVGKVDANNVRGLSNGNSSPAVSDVGPDCYSPREQWVWYGTRKPRRLPLSYSETKHYWYVTDTIADSVVEIPVSPPYGAVPPHASPGVSVPQPGYIKVPFTDTVASSVVTEWIWVPSGVAGRQCTLRVLVPSPTAKVYIADQLTQQQGTERLFISPQLDSAATYTYTLKVQWIENGREQTRERTVTVCAGSSVTVDFANQLPEILPAPARQGGTTTPDGNK